MADITAAPLHHRVGDALSLQVAQATPYSTIEQGGPSAVVPNLAKGLAEHGVVVRVVAQTYPGQTAVAWPSEVSTRFAFTGDTSSLRYSNALPGALRDAVANSQLLHSHGLWTQLSYLSFRQSTAQKVPHVITPHSMLQPWIVARSPWKKTLARKVYQDRSLSRAACLQALCRPEAHQLRALGFKTPIAIIPNGITLADFAQLPDKHALVSRFPQLAGRKIVLFLARIDPQKGVLHLAEAWSKLTKEFPDWHLVVAGPDAVGYQSSVEQILNERGARHSVTFVGTVSGEEKLAVLAAADMFALPSFSEGFSIAVLEAMACRLPLLLSPGCNFPEASQAGAAVEAQANAKGTEAALRTLLEMNDTQRRDMGKRGYDLVARSYTWDRVAMELIDVYRWCLGGGDAPESVLASD